MKTRSRKSNKRFTSHDEHLCRRLPTPHSTQGGIRNWIKYEVKIYFASKLKTKCRKFDNYITRIAVLSAMMSTLIIDAKEIPQCKHTFHDVWCILKNASGIFFFPLQETNTGVTRVHSELPQDRERKTQFDFLFTTETLFSSSCFSIVWITLPMFWICYKVWVQRGYK